MKMNTYLKHASITLLLAGLVGGVVVVSGLAPINASSGHWPITRWFLDFSKTRSVATHSIGTEVPSIEEQYLITKGAGLYEMNCSWCHGSPSLKHPRVMAAATPRPPYLADKVTKYEPEELFYIVKHGIKFTGMPAWPAQHRDDEVWAIVAFIRTFPELDRDDYRALSLGDTLADGPHSMEKPGPPDSPPEMVVATCSICHGTDGNGREVGAFPKLAGQQRDYLFDSLVAYREGDRPSGAMEPIAARLDDQLIAEIADYYSKQTLQPKHVEAATAILPPEQVARGEAIAMAGIPEQSVPSCIDCHSNQPEANNPHYPILAGQYREYLESQLRLFSRQHRGGTRFHHLMVEPTAELTDQQITDVSAYYWQLPTNLE